MSSHNALGNVMSCNDKSVVDRFMQQTAVNADKSDFQDSLLQTPASLATDMREDEIPRSVSRIVTAPEGSLDVNRIAHSRYKYISFLLDKQCEGRAANLGAGWVLMPRDASSRNTSCRSSWRGTSHHSSADTRHYIIANVRLVSRLGARVD